MFTLRPPLFFIVDHASQLTSATIERISSLLDFDARGFNSSISHFNKIISARPPISSNTVLSVMNTNHHQILLRKSDKLERRPTSTSSGWSIIKPLFIWSPTSTSTLLPGSPTILHLTHLPRRPTILYRTHTYLHFFLSKALPIYNALIYLSQIPWTKLHTYFWRQAPYLPTYPTKQSEFSWHLTANITLAANPSDSFKGESEFQISCFLLIGFLSPFTSDSFN